jgi:penicillin-binding protein 1A
LRDLYPEPKRTWKTKLRRVMLGVDAAIDTFFFEAARWTREWWERFSAVMDRFHVAGWRRWVFIEPLSEATTLGLGGLIVMLALAIPAFRETSDEDWLKKSELAVVFLDRYGNEVGSRGIKHNDSIPLDEFPDHLIKATLATEDRRFYEHFGIDPSGTFRALLSNARAGGVVQGGSSISQQLAKNLFLSGSRTQWRKAQEALITVMIENVMDKRRILEIYLNVIEWGDGVYGAEAAARYYYRQSAASLGPEQSARLAAIVPNPRFYDRNRNTAWLEKKTGLILARMPAAELP